MNRVEHIGNTTFHLAVGRLNDASDLINLYHYSARVPANIQVAATLHRPGGLFGDLGEPIVACLFSIPPTRWAEPVLELSRLVRCEDTRPPLSGLIAQTCNFLKKNNIIDLVVSFADPTYGHHGGVYQSASWKYGGKRERRMDGVIWRGSFIPGRSANSRWGTRSPTKLQKQGIYVEPHFDEGKHIYWRALNRNGKKKAERLGLEDLAYPKPDLITEATA